MPSDDGADLSNVVLRRPIAVWVDDEKVPGNPVTREPVDGSLHTPRIPRRRIAGTHIHAVEQETVPVRGFRDGRYVLAVAPEDAIVDVYDPSHPAGAQRPPVTEAWVPLIAVFGPGNRQCVVAPATEVSVA